VVGLRADHVKVRVDSSLPANAGQRSDWIASPKLSLVFGPWANTEWFVNTGLGFHSNDARGMTAQETARLNPDTGLRDAVSKADPLVRTRGHEIGVRSQWAPGLQTTMALWQLDMASELLFVGDAGETEASGASRRHGVEFGAHYTAWRGVTIDLHGAVSEARFREAQGDAPNEGRFIPGALRTAASLGVSYADQGPWSGHVQVRYFGPRPLIEDNSQRSMGTTLTSARLAYRFRPDLSLALDVHNLFDRQVSDIDYFYTSRLPGEAADGVSDRHFHPAEPRTVRLTLNLNF
jgi:outer membrane receptor protein involved in Fe transport